MDRLTKKIPVGFVAVRTKRHRIKLHLMREDLVHTLCGRWTSDSILPEDELIPVTTRECGACRLVEGSMR